MVVGTWTLLGNVSVIIMFGFLTTSCCSTYYSPLMLIVQKLTMVAYALHDGWCNFHGLEGGYYE